MEKATFYCPNCHYETDGPAIAHSMGIQCPNCDTDETFYQR